jgi:membrane protease YdiL (CAAX protease family)
MQIGVLDPGWPRIWFLAGFALLFVVLQGAATLLGSERGEAGLVVGAVTLATALIVQRAFHARSWRETWLSLGLGPPNIRGAFAALAACTALMLAYPAYLGAVGGSVSIYDDAGWLALGILAQGGFAEELVFRGYLYGHLRRRYTFWRAAGLSLLPFALAHLYLFVTMPLPIALAALALSMILTFPFAWLYELGGRTIWAPAVAHAVVQGAIKLLVVEDPLFSLVWMAASVAALWLVFFVSSSDGNRS